MERIRKIFDDVAEAIRDKEGSTELIHPEDFAQRIENLKGDTSDPYPLSVFCNGDVADNAYSDQIQIKSVSFYTNGVKTIGANAFAGTDIRTLVLPEGVTTVKEGAFSNCYNLTTVYFPSTLTTLGDRAFEHCLKLKTIYVAYSNKGISFGKYCFKDCVSLELPPIPNNSIFEEGIFSGCPQFTSVDFEKMGTLTVKFMAYNGMPMIRELSLSETTTGEKVNDMPMLEKLSLSSSKQACEISNCHSLKKLTYSSEYLDTGRALVKNCHSLNEVWMPSGAYRFVRGWFQNCPSLIAVHFPYKGVVKQVTSNYLPNPSYDSLKYIIVPDAYVEQYRADSSWSASAYNIKAESEFDLDSELYPSNGTTSDTLCGECTCTSYPTGNLIISPNNDGTSVNLSDDLKNGISKSIIIEEGITEIADGCFEGMYWLESVTFPESLKKIGNNAFRNCHKLKDVTLPTSLEYIGEYAFEGCYNINLTKNLPASITYIGIGAFYDNFNFGTTNNTIVLPPNMVNVEDIFRKCYKITSITLPSGVESSRLRAEYCIGLGKVTIANSQTPIFYDLPRYCPKLQLPSWINVQCADIIGVYGTSISFSAEVTTLPILGYGSPTIIYVLSVLESLDKENTRYCSHIVVRKNELLPIYQEKYSELIDKFVDGAYTPYYPSATIPYEVIDMGYTPTIYYSDIMKEKF